MDGDEFPLGDELRLGGAASSNRVVSERSGGRRRALAVLTVAALVGVGVVLTRGGDTDRGASGDDEAGASGGDATDSTSAAEMEVTDADDVAAAYADAVLRLGRANLFGYRGTVRAEGPSVLRPVHDAAPADAVQVSGAVHLPLSLTTEVAIDESGGATETVSTARAAWSRKASRAADLDSEASWTPATEYDQDQDPARPDIPAAPGARLGMALLANVLQAADDRREAPEDEEGHRVFRATVPDRVLTGLNSASEAGLSWLMADAELAITLDRRGSVSHLALESAPGRPTLELDLDIVRLGDPGLITARDLAGPIGSTVSADALASVGIGSLLLPGLPSTWALTDATVVWPAESLHRSSTTAACPGPWVWLRYNDLSGVAEGWLEVALTAHSDGCAEAVRVSTGSAPDTSTLELAMGRFTGWVDQPRADQYGGAATDGTTVLQFFTDLSQEAAAAAIDSLVPAR